MSNDSIRQIITQNLNDLLVKNGMKSVDLAEAVGVSKSAVSHWLAGDNSPNIEILAKICQIYDVKMSELLNDKSDISYSEKQHIKKYRTLDGYGKKAVDDLLENEYMRCTAIAEEPKVIKLPMAELKASAGTGQWLGDDEYTTWVDVLDTPEARKANVVIEVSGDSMLPDYHDGDNVLVKLNAEPRENEIGIFIVENNGYIKQLGKDKLISLNKDYPDIPFTDEIEVTFVGKVIGIAELL